VLKIPAQDIVEPLVPGIALVIGDVPDGNNFLPDSKQDRISGLWIRCEGADRAHDSPTSVDLCGSWPRIPWTDQHQVVIQKQLPEVTITCPCCNLPKSRHEIPPVCRKAFVCVRLYPSPELGLVRRGLLQQQLPLRLTEVGPRKQSVILNSLRLMRVLRVKGSICLDIMVAKVPRNLWGLRPWILMAAPASWTKCRMKFHSWGSPSFAESIQL